MKFDRRQFLAFAGASGWMLADSRLHAFQDQAGQDASAKVGGPAAEAAEKFRVWASSCSHVDGDLYHYDRLAVPRESLAEAIRQSEGFNNDGAPSFDWDIGLHLGDFAGGQGAPDDVQGREVVRQYESLRKHRREDFYCIAGNHDATAREGEPQWWFRKWVDPLGEHPEFSRVDPAARRYPVEGTWERYAFRAGNILFLMMSDVNHLPPPVGRGARGGYPAGAVSEETFAWWKDMVESNQDSIIVSAHHHMLRNTTVASGSWEGLHVQSEQEYRNKWKEWYPKYEMGQRPPYVHPADQRYHSYYPDGGPEGTSYLYFVGDQPNAQKFEKYLEAHPGAIDIWLGGHTHTDPDDTYGGKSHVEQKWGATFINVAALTEFHSRTRTAKSRLLEFTPGSDRVTVKCYLHNDNFAPRGWHAPAEVEFGIGKRFSL